MRKRMVCLLTVLMLTAVAGAAGAELKFGRAPKAQVFQIDLSELVRDIPDFPQVTWLEDHAIISGLGAWNVEKKFFRTYDTVTRQYEGAFLVARNDHLEDGIVIYGAPEQLTEIYDDFTVNGGKMELRLSFTSTEISRDTLRIRISEKKKNGASYLFYPDGRVSVWSGSVYMANYENGLLRSGNYFLKKPKVQANYEILNRGQFDGEYWYELTAIDNVYVKKGNSQEEYRDNYWLPNGGWSDPKDKAIAGLGPDKLPFSLTSAAGTPFRLLPPVMYARDDVTAETPTDPGFNPEEPRLFYTLESLGLPAMPGLSQETDPDGNPLLRMTGMKRWGMQEDEIVMTSPIEQTYDPDIPGIKRISVFWDGIDPFSLNVVSESGTVSCSQDGRRTDVFCYAYDPVVIFNYFDGYLFHYTVNRDGFSLGYEPTVTINGTTLGEGIKPEFICTLVTRHGDIQGSWNWTLIDGRWMDTSGGEKEEPLPIDPADLPPALKAP